MKKSALLIILLPLCACAERFVIDGHARTTVDVSLQGEMLIVVCRFPARSRFDDAINVRLNDQKGRRLFLEGLIRYFRAGSDGIMEVSGQRILETRKDGDRMSYKFAVPKDGCKVVQKAASPVLKNASNILWHARSDKRREMMDEMVRRLTNMPFKVTKGGAK